MPVKSGEEIRKYNKHFEESLPETEHNPDAQEDTQRLIEHAAQPLPDDENRPHLANGIAKNKLIHVKLNDIKG